MFYPRKIYLELKKHLDNRQITVITGMRRSGKTTLTERVPIFTNSADREIAKALFCWFNHFD